MAEPGKHPNGDCGDARCVYCAVLRAIGLKHEEGSNRYVADTTPERYTQIISHLAMVSGEIMAASSPASQQHVIERFNAILQRAYDKASELNMQSDYWRAMVGITEGGSA